ncbi:MAG TPA: hypothetical protein VIN09_01560, partial [Chloroflexota bacterium]
PEAVAGVPGPGRWLSIHYLPTALFSLKTSLATSSVGRTLLLPTPYAIKMAMVDAAFRLGLAEHICADLVGRLARVSVRIAPPAAAVVTHTFVKIRQESREGDRLRPYGPNIAYREFVHHAGLWRWAFDLGSGDAELASLLVRLAPRVSYVGKRGSFVQFVGMERLVELTEEFTVPLEPGAPWRMPDRWHAAVLDDFGPEADLATLSSYSPLTPKRDRHRRFVHTLVPLGLISSGPGFSEYRS